MAHQSPYHDESPQLHYPTSRQSSSSYNPFKPPLDDDDEFSFTPKAETFNVDPEAMYTGEHRRGPSYPLQKPSYSTMHSNDTSLDQSQGAYPPLVPPKDIEFKGLWQKLLPDSMACRLYMLTVLVETTIDLSIEVDLFQRVREQSSTTEVTERMSAYLSIFAFAHVFQFIMAVDAVYARNTLQFLFLTIFNALFLLYAVIQIKEVQEAVANSSVNGATNIPINVLTTTIPIVISLAELAYIGLGWKIYNEFGWKVYKFLGADRRIKKIYTTYQIYECLVKFDVFFWAGFSIQFIWLVLRSTEDWEYYVTCAALPLSLVLLVEGHLAAKHENKLMMVTFMSGCVGAMIYFVYKLVRVLMNKNDLDFIYIWKTLTVFSVIAIILLFTTFVYSIIVLQNFGRGLKKSLTKKTPQHTRDPSRPLASMNPNRMSID